MLASAISILALAAAANAHCAAFVKAMYCEGGVDGTNLDSDTPVNPLYN